MKLTLALAQIEITHQHPEENLKAVEKWIQKAVQKKADLVVFPENLFTGPLQKDIDLIDQAPQLLATCQSLAKKYQIDLVPGSMITREKKKIFNTCSYIDKNGKILGQYRKIKLWHPEKSFINPGEETLVVKTRFGNIGLLICWDLIFPEMFQALRKKRAELILCPSYWLVSDGGKGLRHNPQSEQTLIDAVCSARAFENDVFFAFINAAGSLKTGKTTYPLVGHTQITAPFIGPVKKINGSSEQLLIQTINTQHIISDAKAVYGIYQDTAHEEKRRKK